MGHEILTDEVGKFLTTLNVEIQKSVTIYFLFVYMFRYFVTLKRTK